MAKAFTITSLPFVLAEILTGIFSVYFEPLRIPPVVGWGAGVDILILSAGVLFFLLRLKRKSGGGVKPQVASAQKKSR